MDDEEEDLLQEAADDFLDPDLEGDRTSLPSDREDPALEEVVSKLAMSAILPTTSKLNARGGKEDATEEAVEAGEEEEDFPPAVRSSLTSKTEKKTFPRLRETREAEGGSQPSATYAGKTSRDHTHGTH